MPDNKDIFAPPSQEEMDMFAPPSKQEIASAGKSIEQIKAETEDADRKLMMDANRPMIEAGLAGAAQGATFGFSDELGAAKDVVMDAITGNPTAKKWREYQKIREAANKQLEEENPGSYMAGELAGGLGAAVFTPGVGTARVAATGAKLSPALGKFLAGQGGSALSRIAGKGAALGIEGAPIGALYGVGSSEHDISKPVELAQDGLSGATMGLIGGAVLGGSGQVGKETLDSAKGFVKDSDFLRQLGAAYDYGTKRLNLSSSTTQDKLSLVPGQRAEDLVNRIYGVDEMLGKKVGAALEKAQNNGVMIDVASPVKQAVQDIWKTIFVDNPTLGQILDPKSTKTLRTIVQSEGMTKLSPVDARALKDELYNLSSKLAGYSSDQANFAKGVSSKLAGDINNALKQAIPDYAQSAKEFEAFRRLVPETIVSKGMPSDFNNIYMGNLKAPEAKLYKASEEMLDRAFMPGQIGHEARGTFEQLRRNLTQLEQSSPQTVQAMGGSANDVMGRLKKQADELAMLNVSRGSNPIESTSGRLQSVATGLSTTGSGFAMTGANKVGRLAAATKQSAPVKTANAVFNYGEDQLRGLANQLKQSNATSYMGDALENALNNKNEVAKNAVLFKLLQNPEYRNMLQDENVEE